MDIPGYRIEKEIGKGGMATVYLATQESLNRSVVLKVLDKVQRSESEDMSRRFLDEGRIVASLHHPNIVTIFDIGLADEELYISMEYVEGGDLKQRMQSTVMPETALDIVSKIGSALASAHSHNVIHRDVKPANILFRKDMTPLLTDFGIAKQTDHDQDLTSTGIFLGSPNYVSPEQADGKQVDGRTDIYSLGCIFFEMLTGYKPYHSDSVIDIVIQHKTSPVPTLPDSLSGYQPLLDKMMAKKLEQRYPSATALLKDIERLQRTNAAAEINVFADDSNVTAEKKPLKKKKTMILLTVLLIISACFFFGLQFVEISIKRSDTQVVQASTKSVLQPASALAGNNLAEQKRLESQSSNMEETIEGKATPQQPVSDEILKALEWLGKQSLDEYKLTYPPKDNAYYYYSRLLELQPDNQNAYQGILDIAERYAILAERSMLNNETDKTRTYIDIGLQIDPANQALLSLQKLTSNK